MKRAQLSIHAVLLDVDDTLVDTTTAMIGAGVIGMAGVWPQESAEWHARAAVRFRSDPGGFFRRYTTGELDFETMRAHRLAEVGAAHGVPVPSGAIDMFEAAFRPAFIAGQRRYDDVLPFLQACDDAGIAVGALTNSSDAATRPKLEATGLLQRLATVVSRDSLGFGKPDRRVFHFACEGLGSDPAKTAYIGDEWEADIVGAREARLQPVWLRRDGRAPATEISDVPVITTLSQLRTTPTGLEVRNTGTARSAG